MAAHLQPESPILLSGSSHPDLAKEVALRLGLSLGPVSLSTFPDGEISVSVGEEVRGRSVFVMQTLAGRPNHYLLELLILIDALKRAAVSRITVIIPYMAYARQDRRDGQVPITARLVADLLETAGVDELMAIDLHAEQLQGFYRVPVTHLHSQIALAQAFGRVSPSAGVVVAPDVGSLRIARAMARELQWEFAVIDKKRIAVDEVTTRTLVGSVKGRHVVIADDMCTTGGTLVAASTACQAAGAASIWAAVTHPLFVGNCLKRLEASSIERVFVTDTISQEGIPDWVDVVSIAPMVASAIERIYTHPSLQTPSPVGAGD